MNAHVRRACARLLVSSAGPDRRTSVADCRIAICLARGVPIDEIDPAQGYDLSDRAYRSVRARWLEEAAARPESDWMSINYSQARQLWARHRPDLIGDWPEWADAAEAGGDRS
ncbi:hypothetical protein [Streptomyces sp. NPDC007063]|uniref:hypothetical protein n=1 Tax=Streptomyces sp. NPDC007063 TaxID=3364772 RepID=UPI0036920F1E